MRLYLSQITNNNNANQKHSKEFIKSIIKQIPTESGVYRFYSDNDEILYVGKAINLQNRIKSYFIKHETLMHKSPRIGIMVLQIGYIELTITNNEVSALILENNLIKNLKPKYNIIFRDDKTYPLIKISNDDFPNIVSYRGKIDKKSLFFGPYTNSGVVKQTIDLIQNLFLLRTCDNNFFKLRSRACMLYQIKRCSAPCVNLITQQEYQQQVKLAIDFLSGKYAHVIRELNKYMQTLSENMQFELAIKVRDAINLIKTFANNQIINNHNQAISTDIVVYIEHQEQLFIYIIILRNGVYIADKHFTINNKNNNYSIDDILMKFIENYYLNNQNANSIHIDYSFSKAFKELIKQAFDIKIYDKISTNLTQLYTMGYDNLQEIIKTQESQKIADKLLNNTKTILDYENSKKAIIQLSQYLDMQNAINRIECIDISHHHGTNTVASIVVYEQFMLNRSKYRTINLSDYNTNGDDLLAIKLTLMKRLNSSDELPDLFIIDGGLKQYNVAQDVILEFMLDKPHLNIKVIAIYKGDKRKPTLDNVLIKPNFIINNTNQYNKNDIIIPLVQLLRDEAHKLAITTHRRKTQKQMSYSILDEIPNIGTTKKRALIKHFGGIKGIKTATPDEILQVEGIGKKIALQVYEYFNSDYA